MSKSITLDADIIEFDLDGTLVYTTSVVEKLWSELAIQHGVDPHTVLNDSHGARTSETFAKYFPMIDNTDNKAVEKFEKDIPDNYGHLVKIIPGTIELLNGIDKDRWCIVTSGSNYIANSWFNGILKDVQKPKVFITAELVTNGKPDPEGYLKGDKILSESLGITSEHKKIVFEDAPMGVKAGVASGAIVIGVNSGNNAKLLYESGASYVVKDLTDIKVLDANKVSLEVRYD
ncbi:2-deoxyglucose-6-phosphate phosphatase 2 [Wickerhamomyces ciferrii]|uniref:2-deoxyglucose-6-phosphate phosphatase 2 n=1 Tax=Wickerhamomyces ciferrii (strain ATCC 14091 / BCRC 22168 / CBS 111 / JCM 3599 / NBRC 0793 / NRRL Y-1031 F-60-10) TaxID=1206466 RepID=K0KT58_WICCF|nr:2-deoxyglucose-6-phosphate phosphatase 2 [Wickerhamomyces ciferrii]CCH45217.1 2-deoxyglucose-6-phosphate phosphatase 2 [Wickerhamomyces ciferrii]